MPVTRQLHHGDCADVMAAMDPQSIDAIVCDPPYGLEFMGRDWDKLDWRSGGGFSPPGIGDRETAWASFGGRDTANPSCATCGGRMRGAKKCDCAEPDWRVQGEPWVPINASSPKQQQEWHYRWALQAFRVLKPGGHLVAFGGTRTYHRLVCALEDAGFEIRDSLHWLYGQGFPKSLDVGKAIDKHLGAEREVVGAAREARLVNQHDDYETDAPATDEAREWAGWGTALKPAHEPIVLARKPIAGTVAVNVLEHSTGALNIDASRLALRPGEEIATPQSDPANRAGVVGTDLGITGADAERFQAAQAESIDRTNSMGRWPPNVLMSHSAGCELLGHTTVASDGHYPSSRPQGSPITTTAGHHGQTGLPESYTAGEKVPVYRCAEDCPVAALDGQTAKAAGRWPPNVLLTHDPSCVRVGTERVRSNSPKPSQMGSGSGLDSMFGKAPGVITSGYADAHGTETVEAWECVDGCPVAALDAQTGQLRSGVPGTMQLGENTGAAYGAESRPPGTAMTGYGDAGGASRFFPTLGWDPAIDVPFFYAPKVARSERNAGLDDRGDRPLLWSSGTQNPGSFQSEGTNRAAKNHHPTVKPVALMRWLVRLVCPPGGTVLDPFLGSGTTGIAAFLEEFDFIGIEKEADYLDIAEARIVHAVADLQHRPQQRALF